MNILLDECVPWPMRQLLSGHGCPTMLALVAPPNREIMVDIMASKHHIEN
jgi:hypothetical protein